MNSKTSILRKAISVLLSFAVVLPASLWLIGDDGTAAAAVSLPYIEELKQNGGAFKILEIVPDEEQGSLGYLIDGSEPCSDWVTIAGQKDDAIARKSYVDNLLADLISAGLLGNGDTSPLEFSGNYTEKYPWENHVSYPEMTLDHWESVSVTGSFVSSQSSGEFSPYYTYSLVGSGGEYRQVIAGLIQDTSTAEGSYYYDINFEKIAKSDTLTVGSLIYAKTTEDPDISPTIGGTVVDLKLVGVYGYEGFSGIDIDIDHYIAQPVGAPQTTYDSAHPYRAVGDEFRLASAGETGYFSQVISAYKYVGDGGEYIYKPNRGHSTNTAMYDTVYYQGGYSNNNWFLRYVFDWDTDNEEKPSISFKVSSVTGDEVSTIGAAQSDLIVLSGGEDGSYSSETDITEAVRTEILNLSATTDTKKGTPIIVDNRLLSGALKINDLALELAETDEAHVSGNIYCAGYPLVSASFIANFGSGLYSSEAAPFYEVYEEILSENMLRRISGETLLSTDVNPARAVRCVVNSVGRRTLTDKTVISVLELQPGRGKELNENTVLTWLGYDPNSTEVNVKITTMSTAEFIGKIEDISEEYDMVYIGCDLEGFATRYNDDEIITDYSEDDDMDGLIYTNIGETVLSGGESGYSLSGLLDRDYSSSTFSRYDDIDQKTYSYNELSCTDETRTFRFSGNDLTESKLDELEAFADSGYPIVVEDKLLTGIEITDSSTKTIGLYKFGKHNSLLECIFSPEITVDRSAMTLAVQIDPVDYYYPYFNDGTVATGSCNLWRRDINDRSFTKIDSKAITNGVVSSPFDLSGMDQGDEFYCTIDVTGVQYFDDIVTVKKALQTGKTETLTFYDEVNDFRVDNCSYMHDMLQNTALAPNVMSVNDALEDSEALRQYTNLSKPEIVFSELNGTPIYPTEYSKSNDGSVTSLAEKGGSYYLEYRFTIENDSDPSPADTLYNCSLYFDMNGDGIYSDGSRGTNEVLDDIVVREWDSSKNEAGSIVANGNLKAGVEYYVSRRMPDDKFGLIPWSLEITEITSNGETGAHASFHNYTHIPVPRNADGEIDSEKIPKIDVLQVNTNRTETSFWGTSTNVEGLNLQAQMQEVSSGGYWSDVTQKRYAGIYGKLIADVSSDFNITITTLSANELDDSENFVRGDTSYESIGEYLDSFDMVILGFDDCYQELSSNAANAIINYIDTGKATLFTHDCTSFFFLPFKDYPTENYGNFFALPWYVYSDTTLFPDFTMFGYNFNMKIRDAVGLDRYGVTNTTYGLSEMSNPDIKNSGIVASDEYLDMNTNEAQSLLDEGYSIAYKPGSNKTETVAETQGLTKGVLMRYYKGWGTPTSDYYPSSFETTSTVSQVNEGQITTYPFDLNTDAFKTDGGTNSMSISETHFQYQQLNMNSDDIVVWYCLKGGTFDYLPNDVVNSYYIYSKGNVTYSGCGHTTNPINENEAKLFVNTIIAASRVLSSAPMVAFTDSTGEKELENYLVPSDDAGVLVLTESNTVRNICFAINDTNIEAKKITVTFSYGDSLSNLNGIKIYNVDTDEKIPNGQDLSSGIVYCIKLDEVWESLPDSVKASIGSGIKINITATSKIGNTTKEGTDSITLRKFSLVSLS